jgi:hypothetical protein
MNIYKMGRGKGWFGMGCEGTYWIVRRCQTKSDPVRIGYAVAMSAEITET